MGQIQLYLECIKVFEGYEAVVATNKKGKGSSCSTERIDLEEGYKNRWESKPCNMYRTIGEIWSPVLLLHGKLWRQMNIWQTGHWMGPSSSSERTYYLQEHPLI